MASPLTVEKCELCGGKLKYFPVEEMVKCLSCETGMTLYSYLFWVNGNQEKGLVGKDRKVY